MKNNNEHKDVTRARHKRATKNFGTYLILGIWVLFTVILLGWILAASLSTSREIYTGTVLEFKTGLHFSNYADAWQTQNVSRFFMNSLLYSITAVIGIQLISAPAAYVLSRFKFMGNKLLRNCFICAMSIPAIMVVLPLFSLASQAHLTGTRTLLIILYICLNVPFTTTFLLNFFSSLSRTYEEAAALDGCSPIRTFWVIMLPLAQPGLVTVGIFNFLAVWNEYFLAMIFASSDKLLNVGMGLFRMVQAMQTTGNMGGLFAAVVIVFLPTFLLYVFMSEKIIAGVTAGGVKG